MIHQSLSILSKPGQTGSVVWDSSVLMSKFLLSIKDLTVGCYQSQIKEQRAQRIKERQIQVAQRQQIQGLEKQAEHLSISSEGDLRTEETLDSSSVVQKVKLTDDNDTYRSGDEDDCFDIDSFSAREDDEACNEQDMLVFDPTETSILELGSGCGLLGIVMVELCQNLLLTDQKAVLPLLVKNLRMNLDNKHFDHDPASTTKTGSTIALGGTSSTLARASPSTAKRRNARGDKTDSVSNVKPCRIQVQELAWGEDLDRDLKNGGGVDYVVATDVVYNESVVPKLIHTLKELCETRENARQEHVQGYGSHRDRLQDVLSANRDEREEDEGALERRGLRKLKRMLDKTVVLLAQELRTEFVHRIFLEGLQQSGFRAVRMPRHMMDSDYQAGYVIYACFLKDTAKRRSTVLHGDCLSAL